MNEKKVCVITGTRAEYGLLQCLMREVRQSLVLELQIVATAMHLSPEFGLTYQQIENDGFKINEKIEMLLSSDTPSSISKSIGLGVIGFADAYERLKPDAVVILGDRFESLAAAQAAMIARIPIVHIHGGEATEGLIDEAIRHSITKMAHLHFVATEEYRKRVVQLGEQPNNVFNFGAPGIDSIRSLNLLSRQELEVALGFELGDLNFMVTYHPVTLSSRPPSSSMEQLLSALDCFSDAKVIITFPNADTSSRELIPLIDAYAAKNRDRVYVSSSLGQLKYLSALQYMNLVLGNSSSGLIEAPSFKVPTINIGNRQQGRLQAESVVQCDENKDSIVESIDQVLSAEFNEKLVSMKNPYGDGHTSERIVRQLESTDFDSLLIKPFYNIEFTM